MVRRSIRFRKARTSWFFRRPSFYLALALGAGVAFVRDGSPIGLTVTAVLCGTAVLFFGLWKKILLLPLLLGLFFCLGGLTRALHTPAWLGDGDITGPAEHLTGRVVSRSRSYSGQRERFLLDQVSFERDGERIQLQGRVEVSLVPVDEVFPPWQEGWYSLDSILIAPRIAVHDWLYLAQAELSLLPVSQIAGGTHAQHVGLSRGIRLKTTVFTGQVCVKPGGGLWRQLDQLREKVYLSMAAHMGQNTGELAGAMFLGLYDTEDETAEDFRKLGLAQLMAVSGLQVSAMLFLFRKVMDGVYAYDAVRDLLEMGITGAYCAVLGFPVSVMRILWMMFARNLLLLLRRKDDALSVLALAFMLQLLTNPYALWTLGFRLSYGASLAAISFRRGRQRVPFWARLPLLTLFLLPFYPGGRAPFLALPFHEILFVLYLPLVAMMAGYLPLSMTKLAGFWGKITRMLGDPLLKVTRLTAALIPYDPWPFARGWGWMLAAWAAGIGALPGFFGKKPSARKKCIWLALILAAVSVGVSLFPGDSLTALGGYGSTGLFVRYDGFTLLVVNTDRLGAETLCRDSGRVDAALIWDRELAVLEALLEETRINLLILPAGSLNAEKCRELLNRGYLLEYWRPGEELSLGKIGMSFREKAVLLTVGNRVFSYGDQALQEAQTHFFAWGRLSPQDLPQIPWVASIPMPRGLDAAAQNGYNTVIRGAWTCPLEE